MFIHNADIATVFGEIADLLEIQGANQFRVRAYRDAARTARRCITSPARRRTTSRCASWRWSGA